LAIPVISSTTGDAAIRNAYGRVCQCDPI
jgi:hypothetical protein